MPKKPNHSSSKVKFRSEAEYKVDRLNFFAKKVAAPAPSSQIKDEGILYIAPDEDLDAETLTFNVPNDGFTCLSFLPHYNLEAGLELKVKYKVYTDSACTTVEGGDAGVEVEEILVPTRHGICLPPSTSLLVFFKKASVSFNGYEDKLSNNHSGDLNWLSKLAALETSFEPNRAVGLEKAEFGLTPSFNRSADEIAGVLGPEGVGLWPIDKAASGDRTYYAALPFFPFRVLPPWQNHSIRTSLGQTLVPSGGGVVPPKVQLRLQLNVEKSIPLLHRVTSLSQDHTQVSKMASTATTDAETTRSWRSFPFKNDVDADRWGVVQSLSGKFSSIHLVVKVLRELNPRIEAKFTQKFSIYRTILHQLINASSSKHYLSWDVEAQPRTLFIGFVRDG